MFLLMCNILFIDFKQFIQYNSDNSLSCLLYVVLLVLRVKLKTEICTLYLMFGYIGQACGCRDVGC